MNNKNKKGELSLGQIVLLVMGIVTVIALLGPIFDTQAVMTTKQDITDETFNLTTLGCYAGGQVNESDSDCNLTVANAPTGWKQTDCALESVTVTNGTGTALVLNTDYALFASTGVVEMKNTTATESTNVLVDYTFCREGYNKDSSSRTIAGLIGLFSVLALIGFAITYGIRDWLNKR